MSETTNLGLPYIAASQAQKHVTHNEALRTLDGLVQIAVLDRTLSVPPGTPSEGEAYIPAVGSSADWSNQDLNLAVWQDGAWNFHSPKKGWLVFLITENIFAFWDGAGWVDSQTTINNLQNLSLLGVNTTPDATNKLAVASDAVLFNHNGNGVQHKLNKNTAGDTASLLFQTGFSGRAEMGAAGDDDFRVKVSPDGSNWNQSVRIDKNTGGAYFDNGALLERHLPESVDNAGGADWWGPADHLTISYNSGTAFSLITDRMYFATFYVPRKLLLTGCFVSLYTPSTDVGALLRTGIYKLGAPNGLNWDIGDQITDFGTLAGDTADNKIFDLGIPVTVEPGWYVTALGLSGAGGRAIYSRWFTPGLCRFFPNSTGTSSRPFVTGPSVYFTKNASNAEIVNGLPATWARNPVSVAKQANNWVYQCVYPKWQEL